MADDPGLAARLNSFSGGRIWEHFILVSPHFEPNATRAMQCYADAMDDSVFVMEGRVIRFDEDTQGWRDDGPVTAVEPFLAHCEPLADGYIRIWVDDPRGEEMDFWDVEPSSEAGHYDKLVQAMVGCLPYRWVDARGGRGVGRGRVRPR